MVSNTATSTTVEQRPGLTYRPNVDIRDLGGEVVFVADIPGSRAEGILVRFEEGVLSIHAAVTPREMPGRALRQEYGIGDYRRSFRLGDGFDAAGIAAEYRQGVLTVRVPRTAALLPRRVEVRAG